MPMKMTTPTAWSLTSRVETDQLGPLAVPNETHIGGDPVAVLEDEILTDTVAGHIVAVLAESHGENEMTIGEAGGGNYLGSAISILRNEKHHRHDQVQLSMWNFTPCRKSGSGPASGASLRRRVARSYL